MFHLRILAGVFLLGATQVWAATLENPVPGAIKSGVGIVSGWVCDAADLTVRFDGGPEQIVPYGSERLDTLGVCGDTDNGFGLLINYNELGDGSHTVTLYADGMVVTQVRFTVQTLGTNFLRGVTGTGTITLSNGIGARVQWEETIQGFTIIGYGEGPPTPSVVGSLEYPSSDTFQRGTNPIFGWVCTTDGREVNRVEIEINGRRYRAAYGIPSLFSTAACEGTHNGFHLPFDWKQLGEGEHTVVALADGVEFGRATVTVIAVDSIDTTGVGLLEIPGPNSFQSGMGVIAGWVCEADVVEIELNGVPQEAAYGTERLYTVPECGDTNNGFELAFNWNRLGDGRHTVVVYVDGEELDRATVTVTTLGEEFVRGVHGECSMWDFPRPGRLITLTWQEEMQNFMITDVR